MKAIHIEITPDEFGIVARDAMAHGFDVTPYLIRNAIDSPRALPAPPVSTAPAPDPAPAAPAPVKGSGLLDDIPAA